MIEYGVIKSKKGRGDLILYEFFKSRSVYKRRAKLWEQLHTEAEVIANTSPAFRECLLDADKRAIPVPKGSKYLIRYDSKAQELPEISKEMKKEKGRRGGRRTGAGRKGVGDGAKRGKRSIYCSDDEYLACKELVEKMRKAREILKDREEYRGKRAKIYIKVGCEISLLDLKKGNAIK